MTKTRAVGLAASVVLGIAVTWGTSGCDAGEASPSSRSTGAAQAKKVEDVWAQVQATQYSGCGEADCTDHLTWVLTTLSDLRAAMESDPAGDEHFSGAYKIIDGAKDSAQRAGPDDLDAARTDILGAVNQLQTWMQRHPSS
ncbi:hypothetical protein [Streptomyces cadmiisoli]|uniref:hypothetical protein n=1 Tax=Streptomyces cadmiisoli TaxID=2184053 RepID=UPI00364FFE4C